MLPRNQRQEALSRAYVRAIAAQAGVICSEPEQDLGIDLCLRAVRSRGHRHADVSGVIDLQIKSATQAEMTDTAILYDLAVKNYDDLREEGDNCPRFLVVVVMPEGEEEWLDQSPEQLVLRRCAYWLSLEGYPPTPATTTVRVALPRSNIFSVEVVRLVGGFTREEDSMIFRNPWIDPRVVQVRASAAQAYLRLHGWKPLPPEQPNLLRFEGPEGGSDSPTVLVPLLEQGRDYTQRVIELVTDLAVAEDRYALDVLNDILRQPSAEAVPANGPAVMTKTDPTPR